MWVFDFTRNGHSCFDDIVNEELKKKDEANKRTHQFGIYYYELQDSHTPRPDSTTHTQAQKKNEKNIEKWKQKTEKYYYI